jgi:putative sigma-54 modulation protein
MQVQFTARHMELTEPLKTYTIGRVEKLKRYLDSILDAQVTLTIEKYRHKAEISIKGKKSLFSGAEVSSDMYQSIDKVFDKIEKQIQRTKDKRKAKRASRSGEETFIETNMQEKADDAIDASEIVRQEIDNTIVETEVVEIKPMTIEEALMQFELTDGHLFVFRDPQIAQNFNVLYRRQDGKLGLIRAK